MTTSQDSKDLLAPLKKKYIKGLIDHKAKLEKILNALQQKTLPSTEHEKLSLQAHSLAGSGATYGFPDISEKAFALEHFLNKEKDLKEETTRQHVLHLLDAISEVIVTEKHGEKIQKENESEIERTREKLPLILIVDDDEAIRLLLTEILKEDARIIQCETATDALKLMQSSKPNLVLLDDIMPNGERGVELLEKTRNDSSLSEIPVLMISANKDSKEILRGLMAGAIDYILKPIDPEQVKNRVNHHLKRRNKTILLADDDETVRNLLHHKLLSSGCRIITCSHGEEALNTIAEKKPNLVLLDRMMPNMDGFAILTKMQENAELRSIPVIFLTAKHSETDVLDGLNLGAIDYIVKPFNPDLVAKRCINIIERQNKDD